MATVLTVVIQSAVFTSYILVYLLNPLTPPPALVIFWRHKQQRPRSPFLLLGSSPHASQAQASAEISSLLWSARWVQLGVQHAISLDTLRLQNRPTRLPNRSSLFSRKSPWPPLGRQKNLPWGAAALPKYHRVLPSPGLSCRFQGIHPSREPRVPIHRSTPLHWRLPLPWEIPDAREQRRVPKSPWCSQWDPKKENTYS